MKLRLILMVFMAGLVFAGESARADDQMPMTTPEFLLMQETLNNCNASMSSLFYDCECVSSRRFELGRELEEKMDHRGLTEDEREYERQVNQTELLRKSFEQCADTTKVAMQTYQYCVNWSSTRRDDYRDFCECFSVRYSDRFKQDGAGQFYNDAQARADAMTSCNINPLGSKLKTPAPLDTINPSRFNN